MIDAPLSYKKIQAMIGVASSTADDIYRHAVKNAAVKRARASNEGESGEEKGKGRQETEVLRNAEDCQRDAKQWELEWDREQQQKKIEKAATAAVADQELDLLDLL
jgi:hypothetical protein